MKARILFVVCLLSMTAGLFAQQTPTTFSIDQTKAVGEIPYTLGLSPTGAMTCTVPIEIASGIRDMQPAVSLVYNHFSPNGLFGPGWNITGLSSITRVPKNLYYDGVVEGVNLSLSDALTLDGQRLVKLRETYTEISYETEQGQIKVTAYVTGTAFKYFKVYYPYGKIGIFGYTSNTANKLNYPLTSLTDGYGNNITFTYDFLNNRYLINRIDYGNASVRFSYVSRPDVVTEYSVGYRITHDKALQYIGCWLGSTQLRQYYLAYEQPHGITLLKKIVLQAGGKEFNPLIFNYGEGLPESASFQSEIKSCTGFISIEAEKLKSATGKMLTNNNDVLIGLEMKNPYKINGDKFENEYGESSKIYFADAGAVKTISSNVLTEKGFVDIVCANIDGQNEDEAVKINNYIEGTNSVWKFKTYKYSGSGVSLYAEYTATLPNDFSGNMHPKYYHVGDFNGDGRQEILAISCDHPFTHDISSKMYIFDVNGKKIMYNSENFSPSTVLNDVKYYVYYSKKYEYAEESEDKSDRFFVVDYNGDGKSDLCVINSIGISIYEFVTINGVLNCKLISQNTSLKRNDLVGRNVFATDMNGDGKTDIVVSTPKSDSNDRNWLIFYSTGTGFLDKKDCLSANNSSNFGFKMMDINGDGLPDLLEDYGYSKTATYLNTNGYLYYLPAENLYSSFRSTWAIPIGVESSNPLTRFMVVNNGKFYKYSYNRSDAKERLLTGVISSTGVINEIEYRVMCNDSTATVTTIGSSYFPYDRLVAPIYMPVSQQQYVNGTKTEHLVYTYSQPTVHRQGLGFCGFNYITTNDKLRSRTRRQTFQPQQFSVMTEDDTPFSRISCTYNITKAANGIRQITVKSQSVYDKTKGTTATTNFSYDAYGNKLTESTSWGDNLKDSTAYTYYNGTNLSKYLLGFCTQMTHTATRNGRTCTDRWKVSKHDSIGEALQILSYVNGSQVNYEESLFTPKGQKRFVKIVEYSSFNNDTTSYSWNSNGLLESRNHPVNNASYTYDQAGRLKTSTDNFGIVTTYIYDTFGRQVSATRSDGVKDSVRYVWEAGGTNGLYCVTNISSGSPTTKTFYDALGRTVRTSTLLFNGKNSMVDYKYDSYGRLKKKSLPFSSTAPLYEDEYTYDSYDRPKTLTEASGRKTSWSYSGRNVTTTADSIATTRYYDVRGNLTSVSDPGGTITYKLRPDGQPDTIIAPGNIKTVIQYDGYGRRIIITDPSAGVQSYEYDTSGNLKSETDANGKKISYTYNKYHQPLTISRPEFGTSISYNAKGQILSANSTNSTSTGYSYDSYGRLDTQTEYGPDSKYLKQTFTYENGNVKTVKYDSQSGNLGTETYSYQNGTLTEIKFGTTSIWKITAADAAGRPTTVTTGPLTRSYGYDSYGYPTTRSVGSILSTEVKFDPKEQTLTWRKDKKRNLQENFTYDNLNRLKTYGGCTVTYDTGGKGNITSRSEIASFYYDNSAKPYAVTGSNHASGNAIPLRNQTVEYTSFHRPAKISENNYTATFTYNSDGDRVKMAVVYYASKWFYRYYFGQKYEIDDRNVGGLKEKLYLGGDFYTAAAVYVRENGGTGQLQYICRDYLGSITHLTNASGTLLQELSYNAWGFAQNPSQWYLYNVQTTPEPLLGRGYGGHEQLTWFGLVNMNARLYDPAVGRFLSPDPFVQAPDATQSFNRYSYAFNNPLKYTDETGEYAVIDDLIAAAIGGLVNLVGNACQGNIHSWEQAFSSFGVGAAGTWAGMYVGPVVGAGIISAGNSFVNQGFGSTGQWNWSNINAGQIGINALMGMGMSYAGSQVSGMLGAQVSRFTSGISGQAIRQAVEQGSVGSGTGFTLGFGATLLNGGSLKDALKVGGKGAVLGAVVGVSTGLINGVRDAYKAGENPWNGKTRWPSNDGFAGKTTTVTLKEGDVIDRYGETYEGSRFASPEGVSIEQRSLSPKTNLDLYEKYEVVKPFSVQSGTVAPYFGQPGGGIQYNTVTPIRTLINNGFLKLKL
jgi:RHS repeat-associated protein